MTPRVLIVDDDPALLEALPETIRLRMPGTLVETSAAAAPALRLIGATDYDAIISDIKMPGMDGLSLLDHVRTLRPDTPVLLITGHGEHDLAIQSLRAGAYDYIQKPIDREYFIASLRRAAQVRQLRRQVSEQQRALGRHAGHLEETVQERTSELRRTIAQLRALTDVAAAIHAARGADQVLRSVVDAACRLSGAALAAAGFYRGPNQAAVLVNSDRWTVAMMPEEAIGEIPRADIAGIFAAVCAGECPSELSDDVVAPLARIRTVGGGPWSSFLALPVRSRHGQPLGALVLARPAGHLFAPEVRAQLEALALQVAVALENTLLYERTRGTAETLQRSLMPERLPEIPGLSLSARYLPGNQEAVGGDWYDVLTLPNGHIGLVIGDVAGRGVWAAAVMGQLRNALRAYALEGDPPALIAQRLCGLVDDRTMATLVYLIIDPETRTMRYLNLGHLPPLVVGPDGVISLEAGAPPLGVRGVSYREEALTLPPCATILVYTDGLLDARGQSIDAGFTRITDVLRRCAEVPLDELVDRVLAAAHDGRAAEDDTALLALRLMPLSPARLDIRLPAVPSSLAEMRQTVRRWLRAAGLGEEDAYEIVTALNEACANSIEHAYGLTDGVFECELTISDGVLTALVRDIGRWRSARGEHRGNGLKLMEALMGEVEVTAMHDGTEVRMRRRVAARKGLPA
jgi:FixJ family two-component response regulator/anti-sigma regulatory factor (Ser/Thr protein kinase)